MIQHHPAVIENKYLKLYLAIVNSHHREEENMERHHVLPRSLGGLDGDNVVKMSSRKHFLCHYLLPKFLTGKEKAKMINAFSIMKTSPGNLRYVNSRLYESYRSQFGSMQKGKVTIQRAGFTKFVDPTMVSSYLRDGWTCGNPNFTVKGLKYCNNGVINKTYRGDVPEGFVSGRLGGSCGGRVFVMKDGKTKRIKPEDLEFYTSRGWAEEKIGYNKGRTSVSKDGVVKMVSKEELDSYLRDGWIQQGTNQLGKEHGIFMHRGTEQKRVKKSDVSAAVAEGWSPGRTSSPNKGKSAMHKNGTVVFVDRSAVKTYEQDGYIKGRPPA